MDKKDKITLVLVGLLTILIIIAFIYRIYMKLEHFATPSSKINEIAYLDTNASGNAKLLENNYVGVMSDAYNKLILSDEDMIKKLYNDAIAKGKIINNLNTSNKQNIMDKSGKFPAGKVIKSIKSKNNSQILSLESNDPSGKYGVVVNDKCLTVSGICGGDDKYCLQNCENGLYTSDAQKFTVINIATAADVKKIMGTSFNASGNNVYPFNIVRSNVDNTCLAMSNSGVTLEDCNLNDIRQQWAISPDENICLLN